MSDAKRQLEAALPSSSSSSSSKDAEAAVPSVLASSPLLAHHPLASGPLSSEDAVRYDEDVPNSFQGTIRGGGMQTIRASKGTSSASQSRPGYFDLQRLAAAQTDVILTSNGTGSAFSKGAGVHGRAGSINAPVESRATVRNRSNSRAPSVYSVASSSHRVSVDGRREDVSVKASDGGSEGDPDRSFEEEESLPSWLNTIRSRSPPPKASASSSFVARPIVQILKSADEKYAGEVSTHSTLFGDVESVADADGGDTTHEDVEAQLKKALEEADKWKRMFEESSLRSANELVALKKASEAREAALLEILIAAGISKSRAERALTYATAQSQVPVFRADERLSETIGRSRSPLPNKSDPQTSTLSPRRSVGADDQLPASIMEAMLDDFHADLQYHQSQLDQSRPSSIFSDSRPSSPSPSLRSTISRATQAASSIPSVNGFFTTLNWRRKKSGPDQPTTTASKSRETVDAKREQGFSTVSNSSVSGAAAATLTKALDKNRRRPSSSKVLKASGEPNVTRLPGLFIGTQHFYAKRSPDDAKGTGAPSTKETPLSLTQELEPILAHDLRPPALTLAMRGKRRDPAAKSLRNALETEKTTLQEKRIGEEDEDDEYQSSGDEFEVYGGKHFTPEELAQRTSNAIQKQREAGAESSMLTDRYGFVYDATPADVRLLRRARKEASHAPACLTGIRVGVRARGGTDSQSEEEKNDGLDNATTSDSESEVTTPGVKVELEEELKPSIQASIRQASKSIDDPTPSPAAVSNVPGFLDIASCKPVVSASNLTAASQTSTKNGPTSPEEERLHFLRQEDADASSHTEKRELTNGEAKTVESGTLRLNNEHNKRRPPSTSKTVRKLLAQLQETHTHQQERQLAAWDEFLDKRKLILREKSEAAANTKGASGGMTKTIDSVSRAAGTLSGPSEEEWTLGGLIGLGQMGSNNKDQQDFRKLVQGGIPLSLRPKIWYECSGAIERAEPGRYEELLKEHESEENTCTKQIDLDVGRTMPTNIYFAGDGPGVAKLRRLLVAYSWYNPKCGYCQGMNNLAATLLLTHATEDEAFWVLASIVEDILPLEYFTSHLLVAQADQRVLIDLVGELLPKLAKHIEELGVDLPAVTFAWFLSLYTDCLPVETLFRVWDLLFVDGMIVLFRIAMAIFTLNEREILSAQSPSAFYSLMHSMTSHLFSADKLIGLACEQMQQTIKVEKVEKRRALHVQDLCVELGLDFDSKSEQQQDQRTPSSSSIQQQQHH